MNTANRQHSYHLDHLGNNRRFDEIAMFDHPLSHHVAENGVPHQIIQAEILAENLVTRSWPPGFDPSTFSIPPFSVDRWLSDGERLDLGGLTVSCSAAISCSTVRCGRTWTAAVWWT
jgi:glyoxylase-like metal-dependent hydrolase (beta-lactamase superfamily II)